MRPRLSVASLLGIVMACAAAMAMLRFSTEFGASAVLTATLGVLLCATLGAWMGRRRAFWRGFALFGWAYIFLCLSPWCYSEVRPHLLTTKLLDGFQLLLNGGAPILPVARSRIPPPPGNSFVAKPVPGPNLVGSVRVWGLGPEYEYYQQTGHSLLTLVIALTGGSIARGFAAQGESAARPPGRSPGPDPDERGS
jgi:hypothetical protein